MARTESAVTKSQRKYVADNQYAITPALPEDRPPTREECWSYYNSYFAGVKKTQDIVRFARDQWAWMYVTWVNTRGWRKQPDWVEGDPVRSENVPELFEAGHGASFYNVVKGVLNGQA